LQGGLITYTVAQIPDVSAAVARFASSVTDPKAGIIPTYNFLLGQVGYSSSVPDTKMKCVGWLARDFECHFLRWAHAAARDLRRLPRDPASHKRCEHAELYVFGEFGAGECNDRSEVCACTSTYLI
jgi:hypothetical protein